MDALDSTAPSAPGYNPGMARLLPHLRFSLSTLFVVMTLLSAGLGWFVREWQIVQERKAVRELVNAKAGYLDGDILHIYGAWKDDPRSWIRKLLNDPVEFGRLFPEDAIALRDQFKRAFPESSAPTYTPIEAEEDHLILDQ